MMFSNQSQILGKKIRVPQKEGGIVIRNGNKEFMAACSRQVIGHFSAQAMELTAAKEGL